MPAFALGRVQELVYALHQLWRRQQIPEIPIYVDSPLAVDATTVFRMHPEVFDHREQLIAGGEPDLRLPPGPLRARRWRTPRRSTPAAAPAVIIAASGMAESGRILHHLAHGIGDHRNLVLLVGFQAEHTLGRRIQEGQEVVRILGQEYPRRAEVESINGYSAHADRAELRAWVRRLGGPIRRAFVVHGEPPALRGDGRPAARGGGAGRPRAEARRVVRPMTLGRALRLLRHVWDFWRSRRPSSTPWRW